MYSYLLVYFLIHGQQGKYYKRFFEYFAQEAKPNLCASHIFWETLGERPEQFEPGFKQYFKIP